MGLEEIISKIKEEADREIEKILSTARAEKEEKLKEARKKIEEEKEHELRVAKRELENWKKAEIAKIKQDARKEIIQLKEDIIRECFKKALEKLKRLDEERYEDIVSRWMKSAIKEIGKNSVIIPSSDKDAKIAKKLGLKVERKKLHSIGGFVAKSKDGKVSIDNRFESILERKKSMLRVMVGNLLFGGGEEWTQ